MFLGGKVGEMGIWWDGNRGEMGIWAGSEGAV